MEDEKTKTALAAIDAEILALEQTMKTVKEQYDKARETLYAGCFSGNCMVMSKSIEAYSHQMEKLREQRERAIAKMDEELCRVEPAKRQIEKPEQIGFCVGGCTDMVVDKRTSTIVCNKCGYILRFDLESSSEVGAYKSSPQRKRNGGYRPPVHFLEVIMNLTATREPSTEDFETVLRILEKECDKYNIPPSQRTQRVLRGFLKQLDAAEKRIITTRTVKKMSHAKAVREYVRTSSAAGKYIRYTDYYKHTPLFAKRLSQVGPPMITGTQIDRIVAVFPLCALA